jgi:hypothetical protein
MAPLRARLLTRTIRLITRGYFTVTIAGLETAQIFSHETAGGFNASRLRAVECGARTSPGAAMFRTVALIVASVGLLLNDDVPAQSAPTFTNVAYNTHKQQVLDV